MYCLCYDNRIRVKYTAKWGMQIAGMIFQTGSGACLENAFCNLHTLCHYLQDLKAFEPPVCVCCHIRMNMVFQLPQYLLLHGKAVYPVQRCTYNKLHSIKSSRGNFLRGSYFRNFRLSQAVPAKNAMSPQRKIQVFPFGKLFCTIYTVEKFRHQSLLQHGTELKHTSYQPVIQPVIQQSFYGKIQKIHHIFLIRTLFSEIICQFQEIITIINSRLPGCQFHEMMGHSHLVQIIAVPAFKKSKITKYKGICSCHKRTILPSRTLCKCRNFPSFPGQQHNSFVVLSHRRSRQARFPAL